MCKQCTHLTSHVRLSSGLLCCQQSFTKAPRLAIDSEGSNQDVYSHTDKNTSAVTNIIKTNNATPKTLVILTPIVLENYRAARVLPRRKR